jgi:predicted metal-dependent HD superfamily phosphohydrolase
VSEPNLEGAIAYALNRLHAELPPEMTYHRLEHTRDEVIPAAMRLAQLAGLSNADAALLKVGAAFHDLGFTENPVEHELCSARIAGQMLPAFGFDSRSIERVIGMIMATRLPQSPRHLIERLLTDADLDGLGREDYFARAQDLLAERRAYGRAVTEEQWWREQLAFLSEHRYWTSYAQCLRGEGKARNLKLVQERLGTEP